MYNYFGKNKVQVDDFLSSQTTNIEIIPLDKYIVISRYLQNKSNQDPDPRITL